MARLQKIDSWGVLDHHYLDSQDQCHYLLDYTAKRGFAFSEANSLLLNCKKDLSKKGQPGYHYKNRAIEELGKMLSDKLTRAQLDRISFVPVPPSKCKQDPLYDDRLIRILESAYGEHALIQEVLLLRESREPSHLLGTPRNVEEHITNFLPDVTLMNKLRSTIILFDDILTTGSQYKACKRLINQFRGDVKVIGLFLARTVHTDD